MAGKRKSDPAAKAPVKKVAEAPSVSDGEDPFSLLWHSNAPWVGSGYGMQSALFVPLIARLGYRCAFSAFYGLLGCRLSWTAPDGQRFTVYPGSDRDGHGNDVLGAHSKHWFAGADGIVVALTDPWVLASKICARMAMLAWTPVDHDPIMPRTSRWITESHAIPIAMSRFGERKMREAGHETVYYVPHGYDPDVFRPGDRKDARRALGLPQDAFIVGMVAMNLGVPSRKSFSQAIDAFARFQRAHPDALLYLHTKLEAPDGEDLPRLCRTHKVRSACSDQYGLALGTPAKVVAAMMSAFDVLLNPSTGEGFGIPLLEAQACGTPCISTDFSAMPEVAPTEAGNWTVGGQRLWTPFESFQVTPSVEEIVDRLEQAYSDSEDERQARRVSVFQHACGYRAEEVAQRYWAPVLSSAREELSWRRQLMAVY